MDMSPTQQDTVTPEARRPAMSLVSCREIGMLSSVMRALTHMDAQVLRGQRPSWPSSAATPTATIGVAGMKRTYEP
jgi:hypothetical protein